jgi:hypothetical protein
MKCSYEGLQKTSVRQITKRLIFYRTGPSLHPANCGEWGMARGPDGKTVAEHSPPLGVSAAGE